MRVKCIRYITENDNTDRTSMLGIRIGDWYDVLDQKIVDVGNPGFTNPLRYLVEVIKYHDMKGFPVRRNVWISAYQFTTQRELNLESLGIEV